LYQYDFFEGTSGSPEKPLLSLQDFSTKSQLSGCICQSAIGGQCCFVFIEESRNARPKNLLHSILLVSDLPEQSMIAIWASDQSF
jgi:hypothetical protein